MKLQITLHKYTPIYIYLHTHICICIVYIHIQITVYIYIYQYHAYLTEKYHLPGSRRFLARPSALVSSVASVNGEGNSAGWLVETTEKMKKTLVV